MTTTDNPPFDPIAAAAECMQWPTIAEAVRNYHNDNGFAETVFKLIHDDYTLAQAVEICDVLLKRGKYAEAPEIIDTPAAPVIPQPLAEIDALKERITELEFTLECANTVTNGYQKDACDARERVKELEAALQPFAAQWWNLLHRFPESKENFVSGVYDEIELGSVNIVGGHLRKAADAYGAFDKVVQS